MPEDFSVVALRLIILLPCLPFLIPLVPLRMAQRTGSLQKEQPQNQPFSSYKSWDADNKGSVLGFEEAKKNWVEMWEQDDSGNN